MIMNKNKKTIWMILVVMAAVLAAALLATPLLIEVNGEKEITVGQYEEFEDPGARVRFGLGEVKTKGMVDTSQLGDQTIVYSFITERVKRTVHVVDRTPPRIVLNGPTNVYITVGEEYEDPWVKSAIDDNDGDLTPFVESESDLNENVPGEYHISYLAVDSAGNAARERSKITVLENGPLTQERKEFSLSPYYDDVLCREFPYSESDLASQSHNGEMYSQLLFFGDSFIGNLGDYGLVDYSQLWSRGSLGTDTVYDMPITVYGYYDDSTTFFGAMDAHHPEVVLILLNSDRTLYWTPEYLSQSCDAFYGDIVNRYPDTAFLICSITPVDEYYSSDGWINREGFDRNDRINKMNAYMCELCRKYGFRFMNAAEVLRNPDTGCCYGKYIGEDGIHLNYDGYSLMVDYVKHHMDW